MCVLLGEDFASELSCRWVLGACVCVCLCVCVYAGVCVFLTGNLDLG